MLKDITTLKLQGANFISPTTLRFFASPECKKSKTIKGAILYGRNGSGKSTIARAFRALSGKIVPEIALAQAEDVSDTLVTLEEDEKKSYDSPNYHGSRQLILGLEAKLLGG